MQTLYRMVLVVLCSGLPSAVLADGLIDQLPPDGSWVRFQASGTEESADGKVAKLTGTITLSSVGEVKVKEEACRWIELTQEMKRDDVPAVSVHKLLLLEKQLAKGKDPLDDVQKAWFRDAKVANGVPQVIQKHEDSGSEQFQLLRSFLHGRTFASQRLKAIEVDSKLGKLSCEGLLAQARFETGLRENNEFTWMHRMHPSAPFGVVAYEFERKFVKEGEVTKTVMWKLKLVDFGKDAKSKLPDAK